MSGGLISLVCFGNENIVVNGNPSATWFQKAFVRYTHFSQEPIRFALDGPTTLNMDAPILLRATVPRDGDLLKDLVLRFDLPDIYSKAYMELSGSEYVLTQQTQQFQWIRQIGVRIIDRVTITIGGSKIQEFTGDWIAARALLDMTQSEYQKWRVMVGDVPELFDPANGIYRDPNAISEESAYPNVVRWMTQTTQTNAPSIPGRTVRVPFGFWFSDFIANALPLVALQYHTVDIQIQLRPIRDLYTIRDPSGVRVRYGYRSLPYLPTDQYTGVWNPTLLGPLPETLNNLYGSYTDPTGALRYFLTDFGTTPPTSDGWALNAQLEGTFLFLTEAERKIVATQKLTYLVRQIQLFEFPGVVGRDRYDIDVHNIATRAVWFARRSDALQYRNDYVNLTNWIFTNTRPYALPIAGYPQIGVANGGPIGRAGIRVGGTQRRILRGATFIANGTNLFAEQDSDYFTQYVPFKYLRGDTMPYENFGLATQNEMWPLHVYSFAMNGSDAEQPSGTLNTSRINLLQFDFDVEPIPVGALYTYTVSVFMETYNFVEIASGLAGLKFAL